VAMPPPTVKGMKICSETRPHHVGMMAGPRGWHWMSRNTARRPRLPRNAGHLDGIAGITQVEEVDALDHPARPRPTGDDSLG